MYRNSVRNFPFPHPLFSPYGGCFKFDFLRFIQGTGKDFGDPFCRKHACRIRVICGLLISITLETGLECRLVPEAFPACFTLGSRSLNSPLAL